MQYLIMLVKVELNLSCPKGQIYYKIYQGYSGPMLHPAIKSHKHQPGRFAQSCLQPNRPHQIHNLLGRGNKPHLTLVLMEITLIFRATPAADSQSQQVSLFPHSVTSPGLVVTASSICRCGWTPAKHRETVGQWWTFEPSRRRRTRP